jgi:hypothetical protein
VTPDQAQQLIEAVRDVASALSGISFILLLILIFKDCGK